MNKEELGYIISNTPYREYDAMVLFLSENYGLLRFVIRSYYKPSSKQTSLGLEFTKVRLRFKYRENSLLHIQNGELIESYINKREDYDWLLYMSFISEVLNLLHRGVDHKFWYYHVDTILNDFNLENINIFLVELIKELGIVPEVNHCVITNSTNVSDFSIRHGGFVCKEYRTYDSDIDLNMLKILRYIFIAKKIDKKVYQDFPDIKKLNDLLVRYLEYYEDIKINTWKLID